MNKISPTEASKLMSQLAKDEDNFRKEQRRKLYEIQDACEHDWRYEPDPSGNNDSGYYCSGCTSWTKRKP